MLDNFNSATLSTPPPHSPPTQRGAYNGYPQTSRIHEQPRRLRPATYEISPAPGLIRDGEEGYASSLPTSPLDLSFGTVQAHPTVLPPPDVLCGTSFGDVAAAAASAYSTAFDVSGMSNVGYASGGVHSPANPYSVSVVSNRTSIMLFGSTYANYLSRPTLTGILRPTPRNEDAPSHQTMLFVWSSGSDAVPSC